MMEHILPATVFPSSSSLETQATSSAFGIFRSPLFSSLMAFMIAQFIKFFSTWYKERRFDVMQLIGSGGMPSSHSATVTTLAVSIGLQDGFGGSMFAITAIMACIVMHDAFGVRLHAGRQAEILNQIVFELPEDHPLSDTRPLRELLGHTPLQIWTSSGSHMGTDSSMIPRALASFSVMLRMYLKEPRNLILVDEIRTSFSRRECWTFFPHYISYESVVAGAMLGLVTALLAYAVSKAVEQFDLSWRF